MIVSAVICSNGVSAIWNNDLLICKLLIRDTINKAKCYVLK